MHELTADGYAVWQSRGSKSPVDLVAIKIGEVLAVQVKSGIGWPSHESWNDLYALATQHGAVPILATRDGRAIHYDRLTGPHRRYAREWSYVPWSADRLAESRPWADGRPF